MSKHCPKCGTDRDESEFYGNPHTLDGLDTSCKECRKAYQRQWRENNREKHRAYSKEYASVHAEERRAYMGAWLANNADVKAEGDARWRREHPEHMRDRRRVENAKRRARLVSAGGTFSTDEWVALKVHYGNTCLACGRSEPDVKITPDHVVPLALGGSNTIDNIQPLCWGCNAAKQARVADYRV